MQCFNVALDKPLSTEQAATLTWCALLEVSVHMHVRNKSLLLQEACCRCTVEI